MHNTWETRETKTMTVELQDRENKRVQYRLNHKPRIILGKLLLNKIPLCLHNIRFHNNISLYRQL